MKKFWLPFLSVLFAILVLSGCAKDQGPNNENKPPVTVDVMLQECDGITVLSENPVAVPVGENAVFAVEIREGYTIDTLDRGAVYENGTVILHDVKFPTTVGASIRTLQDFNIKVNNQSKNGELTANIQMGTIRENTEVTLKVTPAEDVVFLGYSEGATRSDGGSIVCSSAEYTFTMTKDTVLYTNYYSVDSGRLVVYDGNGADQGAQYYVFSKKSPYIGPNAQANKGQFTRDGYVLYGYNTRQDGSGTYYGPGWSVILPEDTQAPFTLYAQWMPVTEKEAFTYTVSGKNVTITGYQGDHETVVIPETIDGKPVVKIAGRAFCDGKFRTLYLSRNLKTIEEESFVDCRSLTTLYMCDTPSSMPDTAFTNCDALQKLNMLACIDPRYSNTNEGMYKIKYQRLLTAQGKKIIFQGGSNVAYGIDIPTVHAVLGDAYAGVNFGARQSSPSVFFTEVAAAHMNPGDIMVLCPEYHKYQYGYNEMNTIAWQIFEGAYNAYADVDIRHYTKVFSSFAAFNTIRYKSSAKEYEKYETIGGMPSVTKYGCFNVKHKGQTAGLRRDFAKWKAGRDLVSLDLKLLSEDYTKNMVRAMDHILDKGGKVYISFPTITKDCVVESHRTEEHLQAFKTAVMETFPKAEVISDPGTYMMDKKLFYNSNYHLTTAASKTRSELLAQEVLAQLSK